VVCRSSFAIRRSPSAKAQSEQRTTVLMNRFAGHFFERGPACCNLDQPAAAQGDHAAFNRFFLEFNRRSAHQNQFPYLVVHFHQFVQTGAALVTGLVAGGAALALHDLHRLRLLGREAFIDQGLRRHFYGLGAVLADTPDEALGTDQMHRSRHQKGFDSHIHKAGDGFGRAIGVQRGENKVSGKRGLDGDFRGFKVADFADQNNVGILPQESAQGGGKIQANLLFHLHLVHASQLELNRVFGGHDVGVGLVEARNGGIKRVGFAGTCGAGDQHHAVGLENRLLEFDQRLGLEAKLGHVEAQIFLVQQAENDFLAPQRGQSGNAEIELLLLPSDLHLEHDPAILRQALLADVELGHDLEAGGDSVLQFQRRIHDQLQNTVNAEADAEFLFVGLHVNVAGPALYSIGKHQVHELDDGSFVGRFFQFAEFELLLFALHLDVGFAGIVDRLHYVFELFLFGSAVGLVDALDNRAFRGHNRLNVEAGHELDIVHGKDVGGVDHGDGERSADAAQRQDLIAFRGFVGNQLDDGRIDFKIREINSRDAILAREKIGDILIGEEPQLHQRRSEASMRLLLKFGRLFQLLLCDDLLLDEQVTEPL